MAFKSQATYEEKPLKKLSDIPLLKSYAKDKKFCKSGLFQIEHIVPPGRFNNFTLVNYTINVRVNVTPNNEEAYAFLVEYQKLVDGEEMAIDWLGCQITDRLKGYVNIGTDDEKAVSWEKQPLGFRVST